jgi:hypothetical protein
VERSAEINGGGKNEKNVKTNLQKMETRKKQTKQDLETKNGKRFRKTSNQFSGQN